MLRLLFFSISEISAIAFAIYLGLFLFKSPEYTPPLETAMVSAFIFCGICAAYWWIQSGSLALSGVSSTYAMAIDVLISLLPVLVVGIAMIDFWRGRLPLSNFKQYAAYFALAVVILDVTFNTIIMTRLGRRYLGVS